MLQNRTFNKIISLVVAIFLWTYVITEIDPPSSEKFQIPVRIINEENLTQRGLTIVGETEFTATIYVEGKRAELKSINKDEIFGEADVFGRTVGQDQSINVKNINLPETVTLVTERSPKIEISIEELVSVHKPINVEFTGSFKEGTEPGSLTLQPEEVEVKGARSRVESVAYVAAKVDTSLVAKDEATISVEAIPTSREGDYVDGVSLSSTMVDVTVKLCYIKKVPINVEVIGEVDPAYELTDIQIPETVTIRGSRGAISEVEEVTAAAIDLSQVTATSDIPLNFQLPEGVELAEASANVSVTVGIKGISTAELEAAANSILIHGLTENQMAYINTDTVQVRVTGDEQDVASLAEGDVVLSVDVSGLPAGSHTVPVLAQSEKEFKSITVVPDTVHITINEVS